MIPTQSNRTVHFANGANSQITCNNNNITKNYNIIQDNAHATVISELATALPVHVVDLTNTAQCQGAANPRTKPTNYGCKSTFSLLLFTHTITIQPYYEYVYFCILSNLNVNFSIVFKSHSVFKR